MHGIIKKLSIPLSATLLLTGCFSSSSDPQDLQFDTQTVVLAEEIGYDQNYVETNWVAGTGFSNPDNISYSVSLVEQGQLGTFEQSGDLVGYTVNPYAQGDEDTGALLIETELGTEHVITLSVLNLDHEPLVPHVYLDLDPADVEHLYSRDVNSDDRLPGEVRFRPEGPGHGVEMRFRGNTTRYEPKKGYNIRFNDGAQEFLFNSGDRINARAMWRDPSFVREHMAMWLFRELGLPSPRTKYFKLFINDVFEGFYMHAERVDNRLLDAQGLERGSTLVRDQFRSNQNLDCVVRESALAENFFSEMSRNEVMECIQSAIDDRNVDWETVLDFVLWVDQVEPGAQFEQELPERVHIDELIAFFGVHLLIGDIDSLWGNDYWWYKDHTNPDSKWRFIPWDKNLTQGSHVRSGDPDGSGFGSANLFFPLEYDFEWVARTNRVFRYVLDTPSLNEKLEQWLTDVIESESWAEAWNEELDRILELTTRYSDVQGIYPEEFVWNAENRSDIYGTYDEMVEQVTQFRDLNRNYILATLDGLGGPRHDVNMVLEDTHPAGEPLYLVDGWGFTLGRVIPEQDLAAGTEIRLTADANQGEQLINHDWYFASSADFSGTLSLYYRNDRAEGTRPADNHNWYTGGMTSIGNQPSIEVSTDADWIGISEQQVRPAVNRIDLEVSVEAGSTLAQFVTN